MESEDNIKNRSTTVGLYHYQIAAYALFKRAFLPRFRNNEEKKNVMIFFSAHIGDVVMFLDTLNRYQDYYSEINGYHLVFACRKEVWNFLDTIGYTGSMEFIDVNRDEILRSFPRFKKAVRDASKYHYDIYINPRTVSIIEHVFEYCISAREKNIVKISSDQSKSSWQSRVFKDGQDYKSITVDRNTMLLRRFGLLADKLTGEHKAIRISKLPVPKTELKTPSRYYVFAPSTAETPSKCWGVKNYARLIDEVIREYDVDICLSGGKNDIQVCGEVESLVENKGRVHNYVGTTNYLEWISLISNAEMVICNDSSPMHIAASVGTKCVCIGGQWEGRCYYPYDVDELDGDESVPVVVVGERLPCYYCTTTVHGRKGNPKCKEAIDKEEPYPCISNVSFNDVKRVVFNNNKGQ